MNTLSGIVKYIEIMFGASDNIFIDNMAKYILSTNFIMLALGIICSTRLVKNIIDNIKSTLRKKDIFFIVTMNLLILIISIAYLVGESYNPFLYFRF